MIRVILLCTAAFVVAVPDLRAPVPTSAEWLPFVDDAEFADVGGSTRRKSLERGEVSIVARILLGEVARRPDDEVRAVIGVIFNRYRARTYGPALLDVLLHNSKGVWAFTAADPKRANGDNVWSTHLTRTKEFRRMVRLVDDEWQRGPSHAFVNYWHPDAMAVPGSVPRWARGKHTVRIGSALFLER